MSRIDDGGPAFPSHGEMGEVVQEGMSLRDLFAACAIGAIIRQCALDLMVKDIAVAEPYFAEKAYGIADAMISECKKDKPQ